MNCHERLACYLLILGLEAMSFYPSTFFRVSEECIYIAYIYMYFEGEFCIVQKFMGLSQIFLRDIQNIKK